MKLNFTKSNQWMEESKKVMPGGVSSPVRSFNSVGGSPFVASHAQGPYVFDVDGNRFIDLVCSWGPLIHGYNHPDIHKKIESVLAKASSFGITSVPEIQLTKKVVECIPSIEMLRLVNSGTEACMSALRLARAATKRNLIVKFDGHYHGHADSFLVAAGSGLATLGMSASAGVTTTVSKDTVVIPFNDSQAVEECFKKFGDQIAGVMLEVVTGNMGTVLPDPAFLQSLRSHCDRYKSILIFDEVMTGFRLSLSGAQGIFGIQPDLTCLGKIIGGGLPVGAYGGRKDLMELVAPLGPMYQAGTLSGNPLGSAAGLRSIELIQEYGADLFYKTLDSAGNEWRSLLEAHIQHRSYPVSVEQVGSMFTIFFMPEKPKNYSDAKNCDTDRFKKFFWALLEKGVYYPPSQFEACFLSMAHSEEIMDEVARASIEALDKAFEK